MVTAYTGHYPLHFRFLTVLTDKLTQLADIDTRQNDVRHQWLHLPRGLKPVLPRDVESLSCGVPG